MTKNDRISIDYMLTDDLIPYANNPRDNKKSVNKVAASIRDFGFKVPIVIDRDYTIIAGHTRLLAAKKLGIKEVPCIQAADLSPAQVKAFRLADNKTAETPWDLELLNIELEELKDLEMDMEEYGFLPEPEDEPPHEKEPEDGYKEQYGVIVMCSDEQEQEVIYNRLVEQGYECKVVAT